MKYKIKSEEIVFDEHYKIKKAIVSFDSFNGETIDAKRYAFERGDSVAILLLEKESESFLLTNQFRYPTTKNNDGWIYEIPAGSLETGETPEECIIREVEEELGYSIQKPSHLFTFYTSPGGSTERMFLFYSEVSQDAKTTKGGGKADEKEDIQLIKIPRENLQEKLANFKDAKTILAFQWYLLNS